MATAGRFRRRCEARGLQRDHGVKGRASCRVSIDGLVVVAEAVVAAEVVAASSAARNG
jgi:hypothetical protein